MEPTKIKAFTISAICEMLKCSRPTYYQKHRSHLTPVPNTDGRILYEQKEVLAYIKKLKNPDIKIIK